MPGPADRPPRSDGLAREVATSPSSLEGSAPMVERAAVSSPAVPPPHVDHGPDCGDDDREGHLQDTSPNPDAALPDEAWELSDLEDFVGVDALNL